mmetsp:Transcript_22291/g.66974  ORF Transcript_22291/g.66974 Transcript_22291/m.66974 type:complete len:830 (-) Transcript_22291:149-2638(-)
MDDLWIAQPRIREHIDHDADDADIGRGGHCASESRNPPVRSEALPDVDTGADADVNRGGRCAIEGPVRSPRFGERPRHSKAAPTLDSAAHGIGSLAASTEGEHRQLPRQSSDSSMAGRFVHIDLASTPPDDDDDYKMQRASGSPVPPELFILNVADTDPNDPTASSSAAQAAAAATASAPSVSPVLIPPGAAAANTGPPRRGRLQHESPPASYFENGANSPAFYRREEDLTMPSGSEAESSVYDDESTDVPSPTLLPDLPPGAYDSAVEVDTADSEPIESEDGADLGGGFFGRIAWVLQKTREDINGLLGCSGPAGPGCSGALSAGAARKRSHDIKFEEIEEIKFLGSGASGCVFLGMYNDEKVAVKKFRDVEAVECEARTLSRLSHPNIVRFLGVCNSAPVHAIVMEFCPKNLYEVIKHTRIPPTQICEWARQIAAAMEYLHDKNEIHRDLKSPNILLATDGRTLRISDFGTSRKVGSRSLSEKTVCGSPPWMAPELIRNEPYGKTVDVWSYGVVLWELLTGEVPYRGVEQGAIIFGVASKSLHLPVPSTAPLGFSLLLKQCWNIEPKHRPAFRQILLHLDILLEDSGFAEVPVEAYFATQLKWKEEMQVAFEKMKQDEMAKRRTDEELLKQREEELAHARDIRQLYETRLQAVSQLLSELRDRDRTDRRSEKHKRRQRVRASIGTSAKVKGYTPRRRSKDGFKRRGGDASSPPRKLSGKKFPAGSATSPGISPLALSSLTARKASVASPSGLAVPVFPQSPADLDGNPKTAAVGAAPGAASPPAASAAGDAGPYEPIPELCEPSEGWFSSGLPARTSTNAPTRSSEV